MDIPIYDNEDWWYFLPLSGLLFISDLFSTIFTKWKKFQRNPHGSQWQTKVRSLTVVSGTPPSGLFPYMVLQVQANQKIILIKILRLISIWIWTWTRNFVNLSKIRFNNEKPRIYRQVCSVLCCVLPYCEVNTDRREPLSGMIWHKCSYNSTV